MYAALYAAEHPDQLAVVMASSGQSVTYGQFEADANRIAHFARAHGLGRGDHVAIVSTNGVAMLEVEAAAERAGLYYTLVGSHMGVDEVAYVVRDCRARVLFADEPCARVAAAAARRCPALERRVLLGAGPAPSGWEPLGDVVAGLPSTPIADEQQGAAMLYSSGTTGRPKGVVRPLPSRTPAEALGPMRLAETLFGFRDQMTYLNPAPLYHSAPHAAVASALRKGATVVVMERFDPAEWLALVERYAVTHCQMVPTMFHRLLGLDEEVRRRYDLSSLENVTHAAAPCPVPLKRAMIDWLGPIVHEYYGATEAHGFTYCSARDWLARPGTVGRAVLGEIVVRDDAGRPCPPGVDGTIWFRGPARFEYFGDPDKTARSRDEDGTLSTVGDVGHVDEEGFLYLTDRRDDLIISGGANVYPRAAEDLLLTHPAVSDVAVIGVPDIDMGEVAKALVQAADGWAPSEALAEELVAFCRARLAHVSCPRSVDFVDALARTETGKLIKRHLRERFNQLP